MDKKDLFLLVVTLFLVNGFIRTNAMFAPDEEKLATVNTTCSSGFSGSSSSQLTTPLSTISSLSTSKIEDVIVNDDVTMCDENRNEKVRDIKDKVKKRKREDGDGDKAIEKRSNIEARQVVPFSFGVDTLTQMNAFFNNPESQVVEIAVLSGHVRTLVNLIKTHQKNSIRVLLPILTKLSDIQGQNFLHLLSIDGKAQEIRYLFDNFVDTMSLLIDSLDCEYKSALFYGVVNGHDDVVSCLLENGAAILLNDKQFSLMHYAAQKGFSGIIELLARSKIDMLIAKDADGKTPLHIAVERGFERAVETIIDVVKLNKSKLLSLVNAKDNNGQTCLHYASKIGNTVVVDFLLHNKADVNKADNNRMTPLHILLQSDPTARKRNTTCSIVQLFLSVGADVTLTDSANNKPHDYVANDHPIKQTLKNKEKEIVEYRRRGHCSIL